LFGFQDIDKTKLKVVGAKGVNLAIYPMSLIALELIP
jgi:hypothetical protein